MKPAAQDLVAEPRIQGLNDGQQSGGGFLSSGSAQGIGQSERGLAPARRAGCGDPAGRPERLRGRGGQVQRQGAAPALEMHIGTMAPGQRREQGHGLIGALGAAQGLGEQQVVLQAARGADIGLTGPTRAQHLDRVGMGVDGQQTSGGPLDEPIGRRLRRIGRSQCLLAQSKD